MTLAETRPRRRAARGAEARAETRPRARGAETGFPFTLGIFMLMMAVPASAVFTVGPLVLTPLRAYMLAVTIPAMLMFFGRVKLRIYDYLFLFSVYWYMQAAILHQGVGKGTQFAGVYFILSAGVYFLVGATIQRAEQVEKLFGAVFVVILFLLPFAVHTNLTGQHLIIELAADLFNVTPKLFDDVRLGLTRAAASFAHPILFGVFCAASFAFAWYSRAPFPLRMLKCAVIFLACFSSLSSGGLLPLILQGMLIAGEMITRSVKRRATYLFWILLGLYVFLELAANSGPFGVFANYFTLNPGTAIYRMAIWEHGIDDVMRHPLLGFRAETWTRPPWMAPSVDNQWLAQMMRAGIPCTAAMLLAIVLMMRDMMTGSDAEVPDAFRRMRRATLYSLIGFCVAGATVAFFDKIEPLFAFYVGLAAALARMNPALAPAAEAAEPAAEPEAPRRTAMPKKGRNLAREAMERSRPQRAERRR